LWQVQQVSLAQGGGEITMTKTLNRASNVVRVGEVLSFTIALTNNSSFTLTNVAVVDEYDQNIMAFSGAIPVQTDVNTATGVITWSNVAVPSLQPGQSVFLTVSFIAEHPQTAVVNSARTENVQNNSGSLTYTAETSRTQDSIGGAAPVVKSIYPPGSTPQAGLLITFTHIITNDGAAMMTRLPLTDTYDPAFLIFHSAIPVNPDIISQTAGLLVWTDLTNYFGDLPPFSSVVVTTVFTAATQVNNTFNSASTEGAIDVYNNELTAGATQVPITIIDDTPETAPTPTGEDDEDEDEATPVATATPFPTQTPVAITTTTTTTGPLFLPETGWRPIYRLAVPILGLTLLAAGWIIVRRHNRT